MSGMRKYKLLLVDDDPAVLQVLQEVFRSEYEICMASTAQEAIRIASDSNDIAVAVMDIKMPGEDGICAAREIRRLDSDIAVIFHTGYPGEYDEESLQEDECPFDYIEKGGPIVRLTRSVRNAYEGFLLKKEGQWLCKKAPVNYGLVGSSHAMQEVYRLIRRVAANNCKVIILGETGTGKDLVANAIHYNSLRQNEHFAIFSCSHKSPDIIESELFGHVQGAFTNAFSDRVGLFEYANGGTIFLDEIGDLDLLTQGKILRVLETGEYQRVGSPEVRKTVSG
jgi:DNA-binding NtrC family response regulator